MGDGTLAILLERERRRRAQQQVVAGGARSVAQRRSYAGDPWKYFRDVFGWTLVPQQERALEVVEQHDRVILRGGNNLGKTEWLAGYGIYCFDAVAALANEDEGLDERGCFLLLLGPDHNTIQGTAYSALLRMRKRALRRGFPLPGEPSDRSVLWAPRGEDWRVEAFSPPRESQTEHGDRIFMAGASGRHHLNQVGLIEEAMGITEPLLVSTEGMCSTRGNKIICALNPDVPVGPIYDREQSRAYAVVEWDAFEHPNVARRQYVVPAAIDFHVVDDAVRTCRDRGAATDVAPDTTYGDFLYALPPPGAEEVGARVDGVLGHPEGTPHVYRPTARFSAQRRGKWPTSAEDRLFDPGALDEAMQRWRARPATDFATPPDALGVDPAGETGADDPVACPRWGLSAEALLLLYAGCSGDAAQLTALRAERRAWVGTLQVMPKGDGPDLATAISGRFPHKETAWCVDETGLGASCFSYAVKVLRARARGVSFGARAPETYVPGLLYCENVRTWMYVTAAECVRLGLVDLPDDNELRKELVAHEVIYTRGIIMEVHDPVRGKVKERKPSVILIPKKEVKKRIGHSPDRADAFVLACFGAPRALMEYHSPTAPRAGRLASDEHALQEDQHDNHGWGNHHGGRLGHFGPGGW